MKALIATDGTTWSYEAIRAACQLLPLKTAEVHVVSVADTTALWAGEATSPIAASYVLEQEAVSAKVDTQKAVAMLGEFGVSATAHELTGHPATEILALGKALGADVLVLAPHGKNLLERLFLGSTTDAVNHAWPGPVLLVRSPEPAQAK